VLTGRCSADGARLCRPAVVLPTGRSGYSPVELNRCAVAPLPFAAAVAAACRRRCWAGGARRLETSTFGDLENKPEGVPMMLTEKRETSTLTHDLLRAAAGVVIMLLGVGATLLGWLVSVEIAVGINLNGPFFFRAAIIMIPVVIGIGVYFAGSALAGRSRAGVAASVGMGTAVLLSGIAMDALGFTDDKRGPVLYTFWGTWLVGLGIASIAAGSGLFRRK
jgi:hypothetical protein